jgi:hypothetical protein
MMAFLARWWASGGPVDWTWGIGPGLVVIYFVLMWRDGRGAR